MRFFGNIKIGHRLAIGFALILAMAVLIAMVGIWRLTSVADATQKMMAEPLTKERMISEW
jgi:methyl-accepting chemotaxis protein